ncbi:MAG: hypothetical protein AAF708_18525 [Deinococcota bacterium]
MRKSYPILKYLRGFQKQRPETSFDDSEVLARGGFTIKTNRPEFFAGKSREEIAAYIRKRCDVPEDVLREFIAAGEQHHVTDSLSDPQNSDVHQSDESR